MSSVKKKIRVNRDITVSKVRLIDAEGEQVGIVATPEALRMAQDASLDLVEISPNAEPPVCRVMDFGKFIFEQNKQRVAAKKKQKQIQVKEVKFRPGTEEGDYKVKLRNILRFINDGDKAKVTVRFRGREMMHQELGMKLMKRIQEDIGEEAVVEQMPKMEGRQIVMVLVPSKKK